VSNIPSSSVLATTWAATQWTAWRLGYQLLLGSPWVVVATLPLYPPPAFFWWWISFDAHTPRIIFEGAVIAASGGLTAIIGAITVSVWRARTGSEKHRDLWLHFSEGLLLRRVHSARLILPA
jgi:type IV secretion system protein VirD4